jgi:hypothetical protein
MEIWSGFEIASNAANKTVEGTITISFTRSNACDSVRFNCDQSSDEIDESDSETAKHSEQ